MADHPSLTTGGAASADFRINRRAAVVLGGGFLAASVVLAATLFWRFEPTRRAAGLRAEARTLIAAGRWPDAEIQLQNLIRLDPADARAFRDLGEVLLHRLGDASAEDGRERLAAATAALRRAVELQPDDLTTQLRLLELDLRSGDWADARIRRAAARRLDPANKLLRLADQWIPSGDEGASIPPVRRDPGDGEASSPSTSRQGASKTIGDLTLASRTFTELYAFSTDRRLAGDAGGLSRRKRPAARDLLLAWFPRADAEPFPGRTNLRLDSTRTSS